MTRLFGSNAVEDLLAQAPEAIRGILHAGRLDQDARRLIDVARARGIPVREAPIEELQQRAGGRGGAAIAADLKIAPAIDPSTLDPITQPIVVALDQVTDPHNLGAILRSVAAFSGAAVIVPKDHAAPLNDAAVRASAGAAAHVPVARVTNLARTLGDLHDELGYWPCAVTHDAHADAWSTDLGSLPLVLVLGAEGSGLRPLVRRACKLAVRLPIAKVGSLNVSVAAGIALAEVSRQRALAAASRAAPSAG